MQVPRAQRCSELWTESEDVDNVVERMVGYESCSESPWEFGPYPADRASLWKVFG